MASWMGTSMKRHRGHLWTSVSIQSRSRNINIYPNPVSTASHVPIIFTDFSSSATETSWHHGHLALSQPLAVKLRHFFPGFLWKWFLQQRGSNHLSMNKQKMTSGLQRLLDNLGIAWYSWFWYDKLWKSISNKQISQKLRALVQSPSISGVSATSANLGVNQAVLFRNGKQSLLFRGHIYSRVKPPVDWNWDCQVLFFPVQPCQPIWWNDMKFRTPRLHQLVLLHTLPIGS